MKTFIFFFAVFIEILSKFSDFVNYDNKVFRLPMDFSERIFNPMWYAGL